ncbi:MAG: hypothetical protein ACTHJW_12505 [Streptosporangiaceae bacterium]
MSVLALIAWSITALAGLYLLAIWLIEYDPDFQHAAATRLPVPVVCGHVLFAVGGLVMWVMYLITDKKIYCWTTTGALALIATLGFTMAIRWIGVYRARPGRISASTTSVPDGIAPESPHGRPAGRRWATNIPGSSSGQARPGELAVPPERHFPVSVVVAHGILAVTTVLLVVLTTLGVGGS